MQDDIRNASVPADELIPIPDVDNPEAEQLCSGLPGRHLTTAIPDGPQSAAVRLEMNPADAAALKRILASLTEEEVSTSRSPADSERRVGAMIIEGRKARMRLFPASMFNEPAWDMLLALYFADRPPAAADLARWTSTPLTTAMRWIVYLEVHRLVTRESCPADRRVQTVRLTDQARANLEVFFSQVADILP